MSLHQKCAFLTRLINMLSLCEEPDHCNECLNLMTCAVDNMRQKNSRTLNLNYMSAIEPPVILLQRLKASIKIRPKVKKVFPPKKVTIIVPTVSVTKIDQETEPFDETGTSHITQTDTIGTDTDITNTNGQSTHESNSVRDFIEKIREKTTTENESDEENDTMHDNSYDSGSHNMKFIDSSGKRFATFFSDIKS